MKFHQKPANFKLEISNKIPAITSFAGLGLIQAALDQFGLTKLMKQIKLKQQGYGDDVLLQAFILLMSSGGRCYSDWDYLSKESGFAQMFGQAPSVDALERYLPRLSLSIPADAADTGQVGYCTELEPLQQQLILQNWNRAHKPKLLTIDLDMTLLENSKDEALYCYQKTKAYQLFSAYCPELEMILVHEFRDGNVSPTAGYQRLVERCRKLLPQVHFTVRADSAGYDNDFLDWMTRNKIRYYISVDLIPSIKTMLREDQDWHALIYDGKRFDQEVRQILYPVSSKNKQELIWRNRTRNYYAIRKQKELPDLFDNYIYQVIVTNALWEAPGQVVKRHRGRCGTIEYTQQQLKDQCGLELLPSKHFSVNAAWASLSCFTHNLIRMLQRYVLPESWRRFEIKTLRFRFFRSAAIVIKKARRIILRFCQDHPVYPVYLQAQERLAALA